MNASDNLIRTPKYKLPFCKAFRKRDGHVLVEVKHGSIYEMVPLDELIKAICDGAVPAE
jgi:hypothetical protein